MAPLFIQALAAAFLTGAVISSPVNTHIGVPVNDVSDAKLGPGKVSLKQGKAKSMAGLYQAQPKPFSSTPFPPPLLQAAAHTARSQEMAQIDTYT